MTDKPVMLYALSTCSHCKNTKEFLDSCGVKYDFVYVDQAIGDERKALIEEVKKHNPSCSFPTLTVGDRVIVGFKEQDIKEALGI
jgi:glutaredoxin